MLGDVSPQNLRVISSGVQYPGHDHVDVLELARWDGRKPVPVDLSAITRLVLVLLGSDPLVLVDSVTSPSALRAEGGKVIVDLSAYALGGATYSTHLVAYDAEHPRGQVLIDNRDTVYQVEVRSVGEAGIEPPPFQSYVAEAPADGALYGRKDATWALLTASSVGAASAAQGELADTALQPGSLSAVATSGSYADLAAKPFIPTAPGDIGAASAAQGALADTAVQPSTLAVQLDLKVDKIMGYGLSQENYTAAEKAKLAGLDGNLWKGEYPTLAALQIAHPTAEPGSSANVDAGIGDPVLRYIWDDNDSEWIAQAGSADPITAAQVKTLYESNPDTNAYTDAEKSKLGGIAANATANADTDSLSEGSSNLYHTAARVLAAALSGLSLATGTPVVSTDSVLFAVGKLQKQITDLTAAVAGKQATLVSGTNIKTINGASVLGAGNLVVDGGSGMANPMTASGDLIVGGVSGSPSRLPIGSEGQTPVVRSGSLVYEARSGAAVTVTEPSTARSLGVTDAGSYMRYTNAAATTVTILSQSLMVWAEDTEIHIRRAGAGNLTLAASAGVTLNAPSGGTLVMTDRMSVTLKRVAPDVWDVIGQTVAA